MYQGRTAAEGGLIFGRSFFEPKKHPDTVPLLLPLIQLTNLCGHAGHENMGIIEEVGSGVTLLRKGDRVVLPFNVADGRCLNCEEGNTAFCTGVNPGFAGGAFGYVAMGPYQGGQVRSIHLNIVIPSFPPRYH